MILSSAEKAIFISRRSVAKMYNIFIWCMRINLIFLRLPVLNFFSCPVPFLFLSHFAAATFCASCFFSGCRKKIAKPGNRTLINYRCNGPFYRHFFFCFSVCYVRMPSKFKTACCVDKSILALPSNYQENLVTFIINDVTSGTKSTITQSVYAWCWETTGTSGIFHDISRESIA